MIRYLFFRGGKVKRGNGSGYRIPAKGEHLLIFMTAPTQEEIRKITADFRINPEPLKFYQRETHSRRYITKPFQFVMRTAYAHKTAISYTNLLFILTNRALIVSSSKPSDFYDEIFEDVGESFQNAEARSIGHILYNFLQEDVEENYEVLGLLENQIKDVEARAAKPQLAQKRLKVQDILTLKTRLFRLSRQFWATTRVVSLIRIGVAQIHIDKESEGLLGDVHETFLHQIDLAAAQKEMISDILNIYSTTLSNISAIQANELNVVMKRLTSYAAILLVPTLIASIYGMNFASIPFADHQWGFFIILGLMVGLTGLAFANFNKNNWL